MNFLRSYIRKCFIFKGIPSIQIVLTLNIIEAIYIFVDFLCPIPKKEHFSLIQSELVFSFVIYHLCNTKIEKYYLENKIETTFLSLILFLDARIR